MDGTVCCGIQQVYMYMSSPDRIFAIFFVHQFTSFFCNIPGWTEYVDWGLGIGEDAKDILEEYLSS